MDKPHDIAVSVLLSVCAAAITGLALGGVSYLLWGAAAWAILGPSLTPTADFSAPTGEQFWIMASIPGGVALVVALAIAAAHKANWRLILGIRNPAEY